MGISCGVERLPLSSMLLSSMTAFQGRTTSYWWTDMICCAIASTRTVPLYLPSLLFATPS